MLFENGIHYAEALAGVRSGCDLMLFENGIHLLPILDVEVVVVI